MNAKNVLILGMGREGKSTFAFFKKFYPNTPISTTDQKDGDDYLKYLNDYDLIIKSPGISWNIKEIRQAKLSGVQFSSQTQIFLNIFRAQTIGVTGTKGKSTTSSLIYNILEKAGKKVKLVGNIGNPVLDSIDDFNDKSLYVYEMSSHQLSNLNISPHIGVFLNIFPEHLDYYSSFEEYFLAKANITKFQNENDIFIYNSDFPEIANLAKNTNARTISFSSRNQLEFDELKTTLLGSHNLNNIKAAVLVVRELGIKDNDIKTGIETSAPLDDRLQTVGVVNSISFIDDSLATIPQATIAAISAFEDKDITLILGGFDRGIDFDILGKDLEKRNNVLNVILIGQTAEKIEDVLNKNNFRGKVHNLITPTMIEIVNLAYKLTPKDGVVLLSPAATSFDMFKDYKDRGLQFKDAVSML